MATVHNNIPDYLSAFMAILNTILKFSYFHSALETLMLH